MKTKILRSVFVILMMTIVIVPSMAQGWERVGEDNTPGDSRVPLCILAKDGYIFFGDDHVGVFRIKEPVTDTSNWVHLPIPGMNVVFDLVVFDGKLWCTSDGNGVFSSEDDGETWQDKNAGLTHHKVYALTVQNNVLFCGTYHGGIFRYDNGTGTWAAVNNGFPYPPNVWYVTALETIDNAVLMYGMGIGIFKSTDLGETWNPLNNIQYDPNAQVGDFIKHGSYLMIAGDYLGALRSDNNGETWEFCNNGITSQMDAVSMAASETAVFVGTSDSGLFMSRDYGDYWVSINEGFPIDWQTQRYANPESMEVIGEYLYVGTWFYGLWRAKLSYLYAFYHGVEDNSGVPSFILFQNCPNPFGESTGISYKLTAAGQVSLRVHDIFGRELAQLVNERQLPGQYSVEFRLPQGESSPGGIYFYRLETDGFSQTRKMLEVP